MFEYKWRVDEASFKMQQQQLELNFAKADVARVQMANEAKVKPNIAPNIYLEEHYSIMYS